MKKLLLLAVSLLIVGCATTPADKFIGQPVTDELIEQMLGVKPEFHSGAVAYDEGNIAYCVSYYYDNPEKILIVLEKSVDNNREVTLLDYMEIDRATLDKNAEFGYDIAYGDNQNIVLLFFDNTETDESGDIVEWYTKIYKAWTIDKQTHKFTEIPIQGLKHNNEGYYV